jgi:hypothetical protein
MNSGHPVYGDEFVNGRQMLNIMTAFVALSLVLGTLAPKYVRYQLILSPVLPFFFWISLPVGIL